MAWPHWSLLKVLKLLDLIHPLLTQESNMLTMQYTKLGNKQAIGLLFLNLLPQENIEIFKQYMLVYVNRMTFAVWIQDTMLMSM